MAGFFITLPPAMKKVFIFLLLLIVLAAAIAGWIFVGPATGFSSSKETLYIRTNAATKNAVLDSLRANKIITNESAFELLAGRLDYWQHIRPGKYEINKGTSLLTLVRKLRNGQQTPVNFTITKIRTKEDLAKMVARKLEIEEDDMLAYLNNADTLRHYGVSPEEAVTKILPDTYTFFWNTTPTRVYKKFAGESDEFWTAERKNKAAKLGLNPTTAYILSSIVEEETNNQEEKDTIASVYLNRVRTGMPLQADPTVKFALKDFALTRIYGDHLNVQSPYNTYRNRGLPPGPICTPSKKTIDAVLSAPQTSYIYFVANKQLNGTHVFSNTYNEHMVKAREYQDAYKVWDAERKTKAATK